MQILFKVAQFWMPFNTADAYLMGFDRLKKVENSNRQPHVYLKFAVLKITVLIFSFHPSIY